MALEVAKHCTLTFGSLLLLQHKSVEGIFPGFVLNVVLDGSSVEFEPNPSGFEIVVLNPFQRMIDAVKSVPRVETKLFPDDSEHSYKQNLTPVIADEIVEHAKYQVSWDFYVCSQSYVIG